MRQLVIQLARFGDLVQTKRLLLSLLARPGTEVHLCLDESLAGLARRLYPECILHPLTAHGTALARLPFAEQARALLSANVPVFNTLRSIPFDAVYNLNFSPLNFRLASLFDPECVRGHRWIGGQEEVGQWARLAMRWSSARRLGINIADFWAWHHPEPLAAERVNPPAQGRGGGLGVVMAGRESRRSLPARELALLVGGLLDLRPGQGLALLGSWAEAKAAAQLLRELHPRHAAKARNLCGATDLSGLIDVVGGLDLLLTPDTGTMHLAASLGVPVLAAFLSSAWCFETGPYGLGHRVLQAELPCLPCLEVQPCGLGVACLKPFGEPKLIRYLATGEAKHLPEGLLAFDSAFDGLGATFALRGGQDPDQASRAELRRFLLRHLRQSGCWSEAVSAELAQRLYAERDWQQPPAEPRCASID